MKNFYSFVTNGKFSAGCTGRSLYIYDEKGAQIAKFTGLKHAYTPIFSSNGETLAVKSSVGVLYIFSLQTLSQTHKFYFSDVRGSQDDGCCFSEDGALFYNIERFEKSYMHRLRVYGAREWGAAAEYFADGARYVFSHVEAAGGEIYLLGYEREGLGRCFIAKLKEGGIYALKPLERSEYDYLAGLYTLASGFSAKAKEFSSLKYIGYDLSGINEGVRLADVFNERA